MGLGSVRAVEWDAARQASASVPRRGAYGGGRQGREDGQGRANDAIFEGALKLGSYVAGAGLDEQTVIAGLEQAAEVNGYTADEGVRATRASIRSGLRRGKKKPRAVGNREQDGW